MSSYPDTSTAVLPSTRTLLKDFKCIFKLLNLVFAKKKFKSADELRSIINELLISNAL